MSVFSSGESTIRALLDTLLASAVRIRNILVVEAALSAGAYPNILVMRILALSWAAQNGDTELMQLLLGSGADIQPNDDFGSGALIRAADVNATAYRITALQAAVSRSNIAMTKDLLRRGADVNQEASEEWRTALQHAAEQNNEELVILLLNAGADINAPAAFRGEDGSSVSCRVCRRRLDQASLGAGCRCECASC